MQSLRLGLIALMCFSMPALGSETEIWNSTAGWDIRIRSDGQRACFASRQNADGSEVQIGVEPTMQGGYLAVYNPSWTQIKEGDTSFVEFDFGDSRFGGEAEFRFKDGVPGGYAFFNNPDFVEEFSRRYSVKIIGSRGVPFEIDLSGTRKAIAEVLACQSGTDAQ